jgi:phosphate transport system permease protein
VSDEDKGSNQTMTIEAEESSDARANDPIKKQPGINVRISSRGDAGESVTGNAKADADTVSSGSDLELRAILEKRSKGSVALKKAKEKTIHGVFLVNGLIVIMVLIGIFLILLRTSIPAFKDISIRQFLFTSVWNPVAWEGDPKYGIGAMVVSTFMVTLGALAIAVPLGIGTACYLSDIAGHRTREIAKPIIEILAGIPSVVIGFLGIVLVGPFIAKIFGLPNGLNAVNGSILLAIMALPTIISLSEDALKSVPRSYTEASLALGGTKWQTIVRVKVPAALSGIIAACMLGMGRAIGETMTVLMATGCAPAVPHSFLDSVRTLTATIAIELGEVAYNTTHYYALFAVGLVLFVISFMINLASDVILNKYQQKAK